MKQPSYFGKQLIYSNEKKHSHSALGCYWNSRAHPQRFGREFDGRAGEGFGATLRASGIATEPLSPLREKATPMACTTIEQAWFNGADDLIKVAVERTDPSGRELTEYFGRFRFDYHGMFTLTRKEIASRWRGSSRRSAKIFWRSFCSTQRLERRQQRRAHS